MNARTDTGKLVKELGSPVPPNIKVILSAHSVLRIKERLLHNNYELTEKDVAEKLRIINKFKISKDPGIPDHYNGVPENVPDCLLAMKRLSEDTFVLKTVKRGTVSLIMPKQTKQQYVNVSFECETGNSETAHSNP